MCDDISPLRMQKKTRSASICATTGGSMETTIYSMPLAGGGGGHSGTATPESGGTPGYRRRRPATRSQSARITTTGARSVRRRQQVTHQQQMQQYNLQEARSYCNSEPRLSETETPPQRRKLSQRRPQTHGQRKSNAFLDVPTSNMHHLRVNGEDDEDLDRLRTFNTSKGGVINRGDSFRRRRSRSNSLAPVSPIHPRSSGASGSAIDSISAHGYYNHYQQNSSASSQHHQQQQQQQSPAQVEVFQVEMLGSPGVGKQALISQFRTSDCINAYDGPECDEDEQNISIILDGVESELKFSTGKHDTKLSSFLKLQDELTKADAFLVVYSVVDKESFTRAKQILSRLQDMDLLRTRPSILVANKIDLARSRSVSAQDGKCLACTFGAKFIEVSVGINHNCDELLAGTLTQIRLKKDQNLLQRTKKLKNKNSKHIDPKDKDLTDKEDVAEHRDTDKCLQDRQGNVEKAGDIDDTPQSAHWYKSRSVVLASMKARQMLTWILGKEDAKFKNCENMQVL